MHQVSAHVPGICSFFVGPSCAPSSQADEGESQRELVCLCRPFEAPSAPVPAGPFPLPFIHVIWPAYRSQMSQFNSCLWTFAHITPLSRDASLPSFWQPLLVRFYLFESLQYTESHTGLQYLLELAALWLQWRSQTCLLQSSWNARALIPVLSW